MCRRCTLGVNVKSFSLLTLPVCLNIRSDPIMMWHSWPLWAIKVEMQSPLSHKHGLYNQTCCCCTFHIMVSVHPCTPTWLWKYKAGDCIWWDTNDPRTLVVILYPALIWQTSDFSLGGHDPERPDTLASKACINIKLKLDLKLTTILKLIQRFPACMLLLFNDR